MDRVGELQLNSGSFDNFSDISSLASDLGDCDLGFDDSILITNKHETFDEQQTAPTATSDIISEPQDEQSDPITDWLVDFGYQLSASIESEDAPSHSCPAKQVRIKDENEKQEPKIPKTPFRRSRKVIDTPLRRSARLQQKRGKANYNEDEDDEF
jgi:hypothetical protein